MGGISLGRRWLIAVATSGAILAAAANARAGDYYVSDCSYYRNTAPAFLERSTAAHLSPANECMIWSGHAYRSLEIDETGRDNILRGYGAQWETDTPSPAIRIIRVLTPKDGVFVDCKLKADGFSAAYYWGNLGQTLSSKAIIPVNRCGNGTAYGTAIDRYIRPSRSFGWHVGCSRKATCSALQSSGGRILAINGVRLLAQESAAPRMLAVPVQRNLWYHQGWVRGTWPLTLEATDPSGVCTMVTLLNGRPVVRPYRDTHRDFGSWTQCHGRALLAQLLTAAYPTGQYTLTFVASNAAGVTASASKTVAIDDQPVTLALSGPKDALSTAGTQDIVAAASGGPSGVAIACSLDGAPYQWIAAAETAVAVQGVGLHRVTCLAQNHSVDVNGVPASSPVETWTLTIRRPTVSTVAFVRIVNRLRCAKKRERVRVPAQWITVVVHGRPTRVRVPAQTRRVTVVHCHPRVVTRRVRHHGHWQIRRIVLLPRAVRVTTKQVPFGEATMVRGWLGTSQGDALGGASVEIFTAPDNGSHAFKLVGRVRSRGDGSWVARLPAGPSRVVEAVYVGSTSAEPSFSPTAHLIVPASIEIAVTPHNAHWGRSIMISGRLAGGYIPKAGELVVLKVGWHGGSAEIGHVYVRGDGRFRVKYTFLRGNGTEHYRFWATTARENDYPFAVSRSKSVKVTVRS